MTATALVRARRWPGGRFSTAVVFLVVLQGALIFWFSDRSTHAPARPVDAPVLHLSTDRTDTASPLEDPTLFVLPHAHSFSGDAWMKIPAPEFRVESPVEPPAWLPLAQEQLGADFVQFARASVPPAFATAVMPEPVLTLPEIAPVIPMSTRTTLRIEGSLARRRLLSPLELPVLKSATLLTNSEVQLLVDASGRVVHAALFSSSGSDQADQQALKLANTVRFEPVDITGPSRPKNLKPQPTVGRLVFEWQSLPVADAAPAVPSL